MRRRSVVVSTLGSTQTLAWGSTDHPTEGFTDPVTADLHISREWFYGAVSAALLLSSLPVPWAGLHLIVGLPMNRLLVPKALPHPAAHGAGPIASTPFVVLHGAGNGMLTIARGTLPLAMFGAAGLRAAHRHSRGTGAHSARRSAIAVRTGAGSGRSIGRVASVWPVHRAVVPGAGWPARDGTRRYAAGM